MAVRSTSKGVLCVRLHNKNVVAPISILIGATLLPQMALSYTIAPHPIEL